MSYSETVVAPVVALAMLYRYGLGEWSRNSLMSDDDHPVSDLHPTVIENHGGDGTIFLSRKIFLISKM
jgi:hypothetical protein